ncbi:MAG TPA: AMP-binding protein [Trebonia sp.]|nr:AMP-binding protein [Trebonia sp.]
MNEHFATTWEAIADAYPGDPAIIYGTRVWTWREFDDRASRLAAAMTAAGVGAGDTVAIDLYNCSEYLEAFYAALKIRAVPANVNYRYLDDEMLHLLQQAEARVLVHHATFARRVAPAIAALPGLRLVIEVDNLGGTRTPDAGTFGYEELIAGTGPAPRIGRPGSDVFLSFTGGTTGLPKGVEYVVGNSVNNTDVLARLNLGITDLDWSAPSIDRARQLRESYPPPVALPASPMMHSTGLIMASLPVLTLGGTVISLTSPHFDADELFTAVARHRPSTVSIVGDAFARPMLRALDRQAAMGAPCDTSSLITITSAGVAWSGQVKERLLGHIPQVTLVDACGSSEGAAIGSQVTRRGEPASTDRFVAGAGLRLLRTDGSVIPSDSREVGLFLLPTGCRGYRNDPERTARAFQTIDGQRYVLPGDWGRWNEDGTITLIGRSTSTINTGGEKVFPEEVQQVVLLNEDVEDCLVLGVPDERFGQRVVAIVQPVAGRTVEPDEVTRFVHNRLAGYKAPRTVIVATVPRGPNGKALFKEARAMFEDSPLPG